MKNQATAVGVAPPMRAGVSASSVVLPKGGWATVAEGLAHRLPAVSLPEWRARMARGEVLAGHPPQPLPPDAPFEYQQRIWYYRTLTHDEPRIPFEVHILSQDPSILAVDKPHFLPVTPKGRYVRETVLVRLKLQTGIETLAPMHRLDRDTAGVMLFTVQPAQRHAYQSLFSARQVHKTYEAVAPWREGLPHAWVVRSHLKESDGERFMQMIEIPGAEPNAETRVTCLARRGHLALYRLEPHTGKKHQLRAHMASQGLPILGDRIYPDLLPQPPLGEPPNYQQPLQLLARSLQFADPITGQLRRFESRQQLSAWPLAAVT